MAEGALRGESVKTPAPERLPRPRRYLGAVRRDQGGQALVEFALVAPILLLLVIGILDFGRVLNYYNQQSQLVGQGARAAAVNCNPDGTCGSGQVTSNSIQTQLAEVYAKGELRDNTNVCIDLPAGSRVGAPVTVRSTYDFHFLPLIGAVLGSPTISITASQTERQETAGSYSNVCAT